MPSSDDSARRVRLFENEHLEKMTLISPNIFAIFWALALPLIAWSGWGTVNLGTGLALVLAGILVWTLFEYALHRYLFHLETDKPLLKGLVYVIHGNHHSEPNDPLRGLMPLVASIPIGALLWLVFTLLMDASGTWMFLGFATGYVIYDGIHFACHQWRMEGRLATAIKSHHMRHHYVNDDKNFAISAIFWDRVFGTRITSLERPRPGRDG